jgi:chromosome segregation ATPase
MKTNTILSFVVAGAMSFTACTKKIDEKTLSEINQFGTEWTALGEKASNWSSELSQTATKAKDFAAQQTAMMNNMASSKDEAMKSKVNEMATKANQDASKFDAMQNEWNSFKATWDETSKQFGEWKEKIIKGEINPAEAVTGLADFKTKMSDAQSKIESWNTAFAETKTSCEQNMAMAESITKPAENNKK